MNETAVGAPQPHLPNPHPPLLEQLVWPDPLGMNLLEALETEAFEQAAEFLLRYCTFTPLPQLASEAQAALSRSLQALGRGHPQRVEVALSRHPALRVEDAFRARAREVCQERYPCGYGGRPELAMERRRLLEAGEMAYTTNFDTVEAYLQGLLENGDLHTLGYYLCPPNNPYSRRVFELESGLKLPRTQRELRDLLRGHLSKEALERGEHREHQRQEQARAGQLEALSARLSRRAVRLESGLSSTLLAWADSLLAAGWVWRKVKCGKSTRRELHHPPTRLSYPRPDALALEYLILKGLPEG